MKNKKILWIALVFIMSGIILAMIGFVMGGIPGFSVDSKGLHSSGYSGEDSKKQTLEKTKLDNFTKMNISIDYAGLTIIPSDGYYLEYALFDNGTKPQMSVENQEFIFKEHKGSSRYSFSLDFINFDLSSFEDSYYVNLYVPKDQYFDVIAMDINNGNVSAEDIKSDSLYATLDYGDFNSQRLEGKDINITLKSGNMKSDIIDVDKFTLKNDYGDITAESFSGQIFDVILRSGIMNIRDIKADDINIQNDYGDVITESLDGIRTEVSLNSGKLKAGIIKAENLNIDNDYGDVLVAEIICNESNFTLDSGKLRISQADLTNLKAENKYGSVQIEVIGSLEAYDFTLNTDYGDVNVDGYEVSDDDDSSHKYVTDRNTGKYINIDCNSGDIDITSK